MRITTRMRDEFIKHFKQLETECVSIIGTTVEPWMVDPRILELFTKKIEMPLPDQGMREELFKIYTASFFKVTQEDIVEFAKITEGFTGSDVQSALKSALLKPLMSDAILDYISDPSKLSHAMLGPQISKFYKL